MTEMDIELNHEEKPRRMRWDWLLPVFLRPKRTLAEVVAQEHGVWLVPLLVLSILVILNVVAGASARRAAVMEAQSGELPYGFEYWTPEEQEQYFSALARSASPVNLYVFPILGGVAGIWITWFLLGSILHLSLTLAGSRSSNAGALNLTAWASMPIAIRLIVQAIAVLASGHVIQSAGLSGFAPVEAPFWSAVLKLVDIYLIWQFVLLLVGVLPLSGLSRRKAWVATLIAFLIVLTLRALPAFIGAKLSGLSTGGFFYF